MDDPDRFGYLLSSLSTLRYSKAVSEAVSKVEIAIWRELAPSEYDLGHQDCASSRQIGPILYHIIAFG